MKEIDIYDFDKTIFPTDSGTRFAFYCVLHYPWCIIFTIPTLIALILAFCKIISFRQFKYVCFAFMPFIPREKAIKGFWDKNEKLIHPWFKERPRYSVVISASPDFLLEEIQRRLGFDRLICTHHNAKTGRIIGKNCAREEKVSRLYQEFDKDSITVVDVYSDSLTNDRPIFSLATGKCYHIVNSEKIEFNYSDKFKD